MSILDDLLDKTKEALDIASRVKRELNLDENQLNLRAAIVKELLSAMAHSHNLLINVEKGVDVFVPIMPKPKPLQIPKHEADREVHKLQVKLKSLTRELEKVRIKENEKRSQTEFLFGQEGE